MIILYNNKNISLDKTSNKSADKVATTAFKIMRQNLTWAVGIPGKIRTVYLTNTILMSYIYHIFPGRKKTREYPDGRERE
jgi:hypothetical protein